MRLSAVVLMQAAASRALPLAPEALPPPTTSASASSTASGQEHGRLLKRASTASVRETYARAHQSYGNVMARFKPMIDKLLTNRIPNFLTDFMDTVKGFTSDLAWVPNNPAVGSMLTEALATKGRDGSPGVAPLPAQLKVGPGIPAPALCGNSSVCTEILQWVQMVNEDFRKGETPNPLKQIAAQNQHPEMLGPWAVPGPAAAAAAAAPGPGGPLGMPTPLGLPPMDIPPMDIPPLDSYGPGAAGFPPVPVGLPP